MRLGLDLDGCVFDFATAAGLWVEERHGQKWIEPNRWDWFNSWDNPENFRTLLHTEEFWETVYPYAGAIRAIEILSKNHEIHFITHRPDEAMEETKKSLSKYVDTNHIVRFSSDKRKECLEFDVQFFLDDHIDTINDIHTAGFNAYLMDRPWNQNVKHKRLMSWGDVLVQVGLDEERLTS